MQISGNSPRRYGITLSYQEALNLASFLGLAARQFLGSERATAEEVQFARALSDDLFDVFDREDEQDG